VIGSVRHVPARAVASSGEDVVVAFGGRGAGGRRLRVVSVGAARGENHHQADKAPGEHRDELAWVRHPVLPQTCCPPDCGVPVPECDVAPRGLRSWELSRRNEKRHSPAASTAFARSPRSFQMNDPAVAKGGYTRRRGFGFQTAEPHPSVHRPEHQDPVIA
jgi:hypothetical protein